MHRFFINKIPENEIFILSDHGQLHHMKDVLRLSVGDEVIVCDDAGKDCICSIDNITTKEVRLKIKEKNLLHPTETKLAVACAIPRKGKMDDIVDKLTQLGVDGIIPMQTARVIALPSESARTGKVERWQRIARSASEQSQRNSIPVISPITEFNTVLSSSRNFDLRLVLALSPRTVNIREIVVNNIPESICLLIGPEGDFTPEEISSAQKAGFIPTSLGSRVLRVETAAIAAVSYLSFAFRI
jgi:16S rRNA (uracil1498-N3)-methyltransferase